MISKHIIKSLIEAGIVEDVPIQLKRYDRVNRMGLSTWYDIGATLNYSDLVNLIKGLTLAERKFRWAGGSGASVIGLYRHLCEHYPGDDIETITNWIIKNRGNAYVPYGTTMLNGKTHEENCLIAKNRELKRIQYEDEQNIIREEKEVFDKQRIAQKQNTRASRGTKAYWNLVENLKGMSTLQKLELIANDDQYSITYYPKNVSKAELTEVNLALATRLQAKLRGKLRGPWSKFRIRLNEHMSLLEQSKLG